MNKNEREYRITKAQAAKFEHALSQLSGQEDGARLHPLVQKTQRDAVQSQLEELKEDLESDATGAAPRGRPPG